MISFLLIYLYLCVQKPQNRLTMARPIKENKENKAKQYRLSTYVSEDIAVIVEEHAKASNKSISEYLGDILMMYLGRTL